MESRAIGQSAVIVMKLGPSVAILFEADADTTMLHQCILAATTHSTLAVLRPRAQYRDCTNSRISHMVATTSGFKS